MSPLFLKSPDKNYTLLYQLHGSFKEPRISDKFRQDKLRRTRRASSMQNISLEQSAKFRKRKFEHFNGGLRFGGGVHSECTVSHWGPWTQCTKTCGSGRKRQFRVILAGGIYGVNCGRCLAF